MVEEKAGYKEELTEFDKIHNPNDVPSSGFSFKDGTYQTRLTDIFMNESKSSGRLQTVFDFEVVSGPEQFRTISKYCGMTNAEQLDYLTQDLRRVGIEGFKWSNFLEKVPGIIGKHFEIQLKTKGEFQNVMIIKGIEVVDTGEGDDFF